MIRIFRLTGTGEYELAVQMWSADGEFRRADYGIFSIASEALDYRLTIGDFSTKDQWKIGDDFSRHNGFKFSTHDKRNGPNFSRSNNAGGW